MHREYEKPADGRWTYNPPPTWPAPPSGWTPWPGWMPPADWAPAPLGWTFWVRERSWPARHPVWTSAAAVFALLILIGAVAGDPPQQAPRLADAAASVTPDAVPGPASPSPTPSETASRPPSETPSATPTTPTTPAAPATKPSRPVVAPVPVVPVYRNCAAVRAAGKAPLHRGQPGYRPGLDGDADGIACEVDPAPPARTPAPPAPKTTPPPAPPADVYYANCTAAKAAGAAPLYRGQPGYRSALDRDHDGVACET